MYLGCTYINILEKKRKCIYIYKHFLLEASSQVYVLIKLCWMIVVDEKEVAAGHDPEKELADSGFHDLSRA